MDEKFPAAVPFAAGVVVGMTVPCRRVIDGLEVVAVAVMFVPLDTAMVLAPLLMVPSELNEPVFLNDSVGRLDTEMGVEKLLDSD